MGVSPFTDVYGSLRAFECLWCFASFPRTLEKGPRQGQLIWQEIGTVWASLGEAWWIGETIVWWCLRFVGQMDGRFGKFWVCLKLVSLWNPPPVWCDYPWLFLTFLQIWFIFCHFHSFSRHLPWIHIRLPRYRTCNGRCVGWAAGAQRAPGVRLELFGAALENECTWGFQESCGILQNLLRLFKNLWRSLRIFEACLRLCIWWGEDGGWLL